MVLRLRVDGRADRFGRDPAGQRVGGRGHVVVHRPDVGRPVANEGVVPPLGLDDTRQGFDDLADGAEEQRRSGMEAA